MVKKEEENNKKETSKSRKQLPKNLKNQFDLEEDFVKALQEGLHKYDKALKNLAER